MKASTSYISTGANRSSSCSACSSSGLYILGTGKVIALWDTQAEPSVGVISTLSGHTADITTLKFLDKLNDRPDFVSGDTAGQVKTWRLRQDQTYECDLTFMAHEFSSISSLGIPPSEGNLEGHILTGGSDGTVKLWDISEGEAILKQTINPKGKLPLDLVIGHLPGTKALILIVGCTDRRVQVYTYQNNAFIHSLSLEGHEDWVRSLSLTSYPSSSSSTASSSTTNSDLLLASGSQDGFIRLWRISPTKKFSDLNGNINSLEMLDDFERRLAGEGGSTQISTKAHVLSLEEGKWDITLEALLVGHEGGVTDLNWSPIPSSLDSSESPLRPPRLLSTASDNSMIIWQPSEGDDGIWIPAHRFGALGGKGLAVFGAVWGKDGNGVMSAGWNGGVERWKKISSEPETWQPDVGLTGHFGDVKSVAWDVDGDYLLSVGSDQTSRIHAETSIAGAKRWAEIARPQIHGYDMTDCVFLNPLKFASTADEKVTRIFEAPSGFVESLHTLGVSSTIQSDPTARPKGATVPPLGLSNRAFGKELESLDAPTANEPIHSVSKAFIQIPTEDELASSTLWPEVEKVYGHGYELVTCAASHSGEIIATACRASSAEHAVVRLVSSTTSELVCPPLTGHTLTITRIAFSPDDSRILTCSRDRGWRMFKRSNGQTYDPCAAQDKAHGRMVLDCAWTSDGKGFATASRDKTVKIWTSSAGEDQWIQVASIKLTEAATAIDFTDSPSGSILAVGTENGTIEIYSLLFVMWLPVNRLAFRPQKGEQGGLILASCSDDRSVRIFDIIL
ncbi:hypothetical protein TREMEDRAFT_68443 [Tremella mesenterica DSM 1558]|uniref:uncharacterized protein n=1 Tax=Tremella mesenterica (strain ATCC 24925 / CBS 8224 / DSM 1558 / NBRC 9311 / NRRL Y-6157 / RJB 2259-6 / UBC 559-6) TaxID=578456 RepID=UPI0003F490BD|nr:uncharacterized protein TREMEDRAFT_68443 [Tremella mesenterica DSM 1558]EIW70033.1 hypothetical protein TREMEDRAFT_68443 [Tremella mesenterica DSM 1558]